MGIPNYMWTSGVLTAGSHHLPVPSWPFELCARDRVCTMVLDGENDFAKAQKGWLASSL